MKTVIFIFLFACKILAQNNQINDIHICDTCSYQVMYDIKNHFTANLINEIRRRSNLMPESYKSQLMKSNKINLGEISSRSSSETPYSFGIGPSFIIGFNEHNYYKDNIKFETGYSLFLNAGKKLGENFMLKSELSFSYNSYREDYPYYNEFYNYNRDVQIMRFNLYFNGIYGFFDLGKYMIYSFAGLGFSLESESTSYSYSEGSYYESDHNSWYLNPFAINFGIGGGRRINKNLSLTCDIMFDSHFITGHEYIYFTTRIGLSFNL